MNGTLRSIDEITKSRRMRRMRQFNWSRRLIRENYLTVNDLIWPIFLCEGSSVCEPVEKMPGVERFSIDIAIEKALYAVELGIPAVAPFSCEPVFRKTENGYYLLDPDNLTNRFVRCLKKKSSNIGVITDTALDAYTIHGHDGILCNNVILNDETVEIMAQGALEQAKAGSDIIAPSDMMDGRIGAIRDMLDAHGFQNVAILSYAAKFASAFYGPYRDAIGTANLLKGDKKTYYLDPANSEEALREVQSDLWEGADMIMVKPGLPYLDIISQVKRSHLMIPIFAYQVSGEYVMIKAAAANGWINEDRIIMESLLSFKRAGCDAVITYFATDVAKKLRQSK